MFSQKFVVKSDDQRLIYAEVYNPLVVDTQGETMTEGAIQRMAHRFISKGRYNKIDVSHNKEESGAKVVESFIVRSSDDPDGFMSGSWVLGIKIPEGNLWEAVKSGELNALSFSGPSMNTDLMTKVVLLKKAECETEKSMIGLVPEHSHRVIMKFDGDGKVIPGPTEEFLGHKHLITKTCATERFFDHSHRVIIVSSKGDLSDI